MSYPKVPITWNPGEEHRRRLAEGINALMDGRVNSTGSLTFTANVGSTTVTDVKCSVNSVPLLVPTTQLAAQAEWWVPTVTDGSFNVSHGTSSATTRTFLYLLMG